MTEDIPETELEEKAEQFILNIAKECACNIAIVYFTSDEAEYKFHEVEHRLQTAIYKAGCKELTPIRYILNYTFCGDLATDCNKIIGWISWFTRKAVEAMPKEICEQYGEKNIYHSLFSTAYDYYKRMNEIY